ncbi:MAG: hypothetical protein E6767_06655 [Dysgonomonas sp.]|nr:hypothetical protein [Dysgonomonas sp.]
MIEAKELRIGNVVKCMGSYYYYQPNPQYVYSKIMEIRDNIVETNISTHKYKDILPIELNEDILLKIGGKRIASAEISFAENEHDSTSLSILNEDGTFYLKSKDNYIINVPIRTVHQFQNLYFYIKGKEIKIEL